MGEDLQDGEHCELSRQIEASEGCRPNPTISIQVSKLIKYRFIELCKGCVHGPSNPIATCDTTT
jgi:hypothetical protein